LFRNNSKRNSLGKTVGIVDLTRGELDTEVNIRDQEANAAAKTFGPQVREN
jgi:hypothetical protein